MLNYILPPILIIISVSALIMFLFKKAAQIPADDFIADEYKREEQKNGTKMVSMLGQFSLKFLERLIHRAKLLSLKFHNVSNVWFQTIREKRQKNAQLQKEAEEKKNEQMIIDRQRRESGVVQDENFAPIEIEPRPMVRAKMTMPQPKPAKEKNQLEEVLIKRIAMNPKDIEAYERLGDYYLENANAQDSLECFKQVLKLSPTHQKAKLRIKRLERLK